MSHVLWGYIYEQTRQNVRHTCTQTKGKHTWCLPGYFLAGFVTAHCLSFRCTRYCCRRRRACLSNLPASLVKETTSVSQTVSVKQLKINILCCAAVNISPPKHGSSASKLQIFKGNYPHLPSVQRIHALPASFITLPEGESCSVGSDDDYVLAEASTISSYLFFFQIAKRKKKSIWKTASPVFRIK